MVKNETIKEIIRKLLLLSRKAVLMRKNGYAIMVIQFLTVIIFMLQIRLIFEPQALHLQHHKLERVSTILKQMPKDVKCRYFPNDRFVSELMSKVGRLLKIQIKPASPNETEVKNSRTKSLWAIFTLNEDENKNNVPKVLEYKIRSYDYKNGLTAVWDDEEPSKEDPYTRTGFIPLQIAIDISFLEMWKSGQSYNSRNKIWIGRFPYHTVNLLVMPVFLEPSVTIAYCLMIMALLLIPAELLHKVVHDKGKGFRQLMHVMGMSLTMLYAGWILYMLIVAVPSTIFCTVILNPVLENVYPFTIFMFILLYLTMSSCFMFFVGTFFDDSLKASLIGTMLWLIMSYLSTVLDNHTNKMNLSYKIASLCLPHNGLLYGLFNFAARQKMVHSVTNNTKSFDNTATLRFDAESDSTSLLKSLDLEEASNLVHKKHQISVSVILISWILHAVLWMALAFYFDNLKPGRHGAAKHWYYPCQKCVSVPLIEDINYRGTTKWSTVEKTRPGLTPIMTIRQLTKKFGSRKNPVIAIDGMTMDFHEGEFHIILGHNGAGKSTLLKMIVGMYRPSKGRIYIHGRDYNRQQDSRENLIGYCPQDNILVNDLTAIEHVYLFGMLKGISYNDAYEKAESMLTQLGLKANKNQQIKHFTLGMKRRVCLSMALIGNAKILVLDEPGYGVDPQNRRKIWDTLLAFKAERTIIMTTNSMEAADVLPDRIAIIANGKVECYGSKTYLNRRFGVAYLLSIVLEEECDLDHLTNTIQNFSSDPIKLRTRLGSVVKYDLPRRTAFTKLLHYLETNTRLLRIKSMGLNVTSIEEQFRRIGFMSSIKSRRGMNYFYNDHEFEMMIRKRRHDLLTKGQTWIRSTGNTLFVQQIGIMFYKKCLHIFAFWDIYGYSLLFSLVSFIVCMEMARKMNLHISTTRINEVNISRYTESNLGILLHDNTDSKVLLNSFIDTINYYDANETRSNYYVSNVLTAAKLISDPTWHSMKIREHYFMGIDVSKTTMISLFYSVTASHSGPISINFLHNALLRYNGCDDCEIKIKTEPILDPAEWQSRIVDTAGVRNWQNFALAITLFLLLPSINLITKELRSSSKQLQLNTSEMTLLKYWLPIYIVDVLIYFLCVLFIVSLIPISYREASHVSITDFVVMLIIFLLYGIAALPMGYILHFFVKRVEIACIIVIMLNVITLIFINGNLTHPILMRIIPKTGRQIGGIIFHIFPQYVLACAIGTFLAIHAYNEQCEHLDGCSTPFWAEDPCCQACGNQGCYKRLSIIWTKRITNMFHHSILIDMTILLVDAVVFFLIIIIFESRTKARIKRYFQRQIYPSELTDSITEPRVLLEKEKVEDFMKEYESGETVSYDVMLSVQKLTKKFRGKAVVRGINFNLYKNECLGLLGINGAGKSTIFKMLIGEELPTSGRAIVTQNHNLMKDVISSKIGYCPQIGGLNNFMTARQNLRLHATLRGIPPDRVKDEVDKWLDVFDLLDFENIRVRYCPWGIRRKISILQSLIGDLPIVLLDEPTSGLDAIARQVVCDTLHFVREMGRSLLVTTQSMEESEILCLRIGVLVNGQFVAFGSSEQLKHQHGEYFTLNIVIQGAASLEKINEIKKSVENMFTGFNFKSLHAGVIKYEIDAGVTMYSRIFEKLEKLKAKHPEISESSVSQTTMEQVLLSLCEKYQDSKSPEEKPICVQKFINATHHI